MDKSITDFNVRLRTIRLWELIVGIIVTLIITGILAVIFPVIEESDGLFFIVIFLIGALLFVWALRGTKGLDRILKVCLKSITEKKYYMFLQLTYYLHVYSHF